MADLQKGYTFSGTSPNNSVTAEKLNTLVDGATIQTGFFMGKGENTSAADGDYLLLYEANSGSYRKIQKRNLVTQGKAKTGFRNLVIVNTISAPATRMEVTADEVVMRSFDGNVYHTSGLVATLDITVYLGTATPNGRDFAPLQPHTFYGVWAISDGTNDRTLLSTAQTPGSTPTLPVGYRYFALLGVVRTWIGAALSPFVQRGCEVTVTPACAANASLSDANPVIGGGEFGGASGGVQINVTSRTFSDVNLVRCVPALASRVRGILGVTVASGTVADVTYALAGKGIGALNSSPTSTLGLQLYTVFVEASGVGASYGYFGACQFDVGIVIPQQISAAVTGGGSVHAMRISGYTLNL